MRIAVAGATGVVGRHVVDEVRRSGHEPVSLARTLGVDVVTGKGLAESLEGVDVVVDVLGTPALGRSNATEFFETTSTNLLPAEGHAGVRHHVVLSIVGIDEVPFGYYQAKL
ncbi:MAG TPA: NAD(P)H-binding protein, partial [Nocardioides sp.]|nr:NAD(P)H-binding protein [Nocardioides sp.]